MSKEAEYVIKGSPFYSVKGLPLGVFLLPLDESIAGYSTLKKKKHQTILLTKECCLFAEGCDQWNVFQMSIITAPPTFP